MTFITGSVDDGAEALEGLADEGVFAAATGKLATCNAKMQLAKVRASFFAKLIREDGFSRDDKYASEFMSTISHWTDHAQRNCET
jgi:hypothetical protein